MESAESVIIYYIKIIAVVILGTTIIMSIIDNYCNVTREWRKTIKIAIGAIIILISTAIIRI